MKRIFLTVIYSLILLFLYNCSGTITTNNLYLNSQFDGHTTYIKIDSKVKRYNKGDILDPCLGKTKITTSKNITLDILAKEIKKNNSHIELIEINDVLVMYEKSEDQTKNYSYFIKLVESFKKTNKFIIGELRFAIEDENADEGYSIYVFPLQYIEDEKVDNYILDTIFFKYGEKYKYSSKFTIDDFVNYYKKLGWMSVTKNNNEIILNNLLSNNNKFNASLKLKFENNYQFSIEKI